jgi:SAM-dependent methyltransferase
LRHRFWLGCSERLRWSRGAFHESPALELPVRPPAEAERIAALRNRYQVRFELGLCAATSLGNYEYLDVLDRSWAAAGLDRPAGGTLCDVGCANFWYAAGLQAFFQPRRLVGIDVEGHRLYRDGHTRVDYAAGYLAAYPHAEFLIGDFPDRVEPADVITAWFPFLTPQAILAWRLPLSLLAPDRLFAGVRRRLRARGVFFMVNHGPEEARIAAEYCVAAGLRQIGRATGSGLLSAHRLQPVVASCWQAR